MQQSFLALFAGEIIAGVAYHLEIQSRLSTKLPRVCILGVLPNFAVVQRHTHRTEFLQSVGREEYINGHMSASKYQMENASLQDTYQYVQ